MAVRRLVVLALAVLAMPAYAEPADPVVVQVGEAKLTAADVRQRLAAMPDFQRRAFGKTDDEIRRRFVADVLVPELLFAEHARQTNVAAVPHVRLRLREALSRALGDAVLADAERQGIPDAELHAYYDAHRSDYEKPERIRIARILVDDEALAKRVLSESVGTAGLDHWKDLAREHSLDAATKFRGGMLGFVYPDGRTDVPQVAVDPALYAAAAKVKNGELVPAPVAESGHLALVWRRGSLPAVASSFDAERAAIQRLLVRERAERTLASLRDELRQKDVKDENTALLESLKDESPELAASSTPPATPAGAKASSVNPVPKPGERGLR